MKIKIVTYPRKEISVKHDIEIIKSIILYTDKIELVSPNTTMLLSFYSLPYISEIQKIDFLKEIYPVFYSDQKMQSDLNNTLDIYVKLLKKSRKVGKQLKLFLMIKKGINEAWEKLRENIEKQFDTTDTGIEELLPLIKENI